MEQIIAISQSITTIAWALLSLLWLIVLIYSIVLLVKFDRLMGQIIRTAQSIQQVSQLPLHIVNSLLQKLLWTTDQP